MEHKNNLETMWNAYAPPPKTYYLPPYFESNQVKNVYKPKLMKGRDLLLRIVNLIHTGTFKDLKKPL